MSVSLGGDKHYLAGASLGKIVDILVTKGIPSPTEKPKWIRATVDKLLDNKKYVPIVGAKVYLDAQFEKNRRCNVDYDKAGHPRKTVRYQSPSLETQGKSIYFLRFENPPKRYQIPNNFDSKIGLTTLD